MIYDYRTDLEQGRSYRVRMIDEATAQSLPVIYYDTETHLCCRFLKDIDGALLGRWPAGVVNGMVTAESPDPDAEAEILYLWEYRPLTVLSFEEYRERFGQSLPTRLVLHGHTALSFGSKNMPLLPLENPLKITGNVQDKE